MDQGIWATWYDLAAGARDRHVEWLHGEYLPSLVARPGIAWAAHYAATGGSELMQTIASRLPRGPEGEMGSGTQYVVLVGATSPHVFFRPDSPSLEANQDEDTRKRLADRQGARPCVFLEEARVTGPEYTRATPGGAPGPAIQMGSFRIRSTAEEFDLGAWYAEYRLPLMSALPGCIATRKLMCVAGWAKHAVLYEFTSIEARMENFEKRHEADALDDKEWTGRIVKYTVHAPGSPTIGQRLWPPVE